MHAAARTATKPKVVLRCALCAAEALADNCARETPMVSRMRAIHCLPERDVPSMKTEKTAVVRILT